MPNSSTPIPMRSAMTKCPSSWTNIRKPRAGTTDKYQSQLVDMRELLSPQRSAGGRRALATSENRLATLHAVYRIRISPSTSERGNRRSGPQKEGYQHDRVCPHDRG